MACLVVEVEGILDHAGLSGQRGPSRRQHAVGEIAWQAVPQRLPDHLVLDEIAWIWRVVGEICSLVRDAEHQVGHRLQEGEVALGTGADLNKQLVPLERDARGVRDSFQ